MFQYNILPSDEKLIKKNIEFKEVGKGGLLDIHHTIIINDHPCAWNTRGWVVNSV